MEKLKVSSSYIKIFRSHIQYFIDKKIITEYQGKKMLCCLETKSIEFIVVVTIIGAIMIGLGILLFIASNWDYISKVNKIILMFLLMTSFYISGIKIQYKYFALGKGFIYISICIFGGGLFLTDQLLNLNFDISNLFLFWIIGILPMGYILKDKLIYFFIQTLSLWYMIFNIERVSILTSQMFSINLLFIIFILISLIFINYMKFTKKLFVVMNNFYIMFVLIYISEWINIGDLYEIIAIFCFGLYLFYCRFFFENVNEINLVQGIIFMGVSGLIMTYENIWEEITIINNGILFSVSWSVIFGLYLLWLVNKKHIIAIVFICGLLIRYYIDKFYSFIPKSMFFIFFGIILLIFGFYLEKLNRQKGANKK